MQKRDGRKYGLRKAGKEENNVCSGDAETSGNQKDRELLAGTQEFFKTEIINGQMRVDLESFEKWYANQVKHKKVNGEDPGAELTTIGEVQLSGINNHFMEKYYTDLLKMPAVKSSRNPDGDKLITAATVHQIHKVLRSCFRQAVK